MSLRGGGGEGGGGVTVLYVGDTDTGTPGKFPKTRNSYPKFIRSKIS